MPLGSVAGEDNAELISFWSDCLGISRIDFAAFQDVSFLVHSSWSLICPPLPVEIRTDTYRDGNSQPIKLSHFKLAALSTDPSATVSHTRAGDFQIL
jgi:hypothetical protein